MTSGDIGRLRIESEAFGEWSKEQVAVEPTMQHPELPRTYREKREMSEPTAEGLKRYPETAGYNVDLASPIPCVCTPACHARCAGECGCEACSVQFRSFCEATDRLSALVPTSRAEEEALDAYRGVKATEPLSIIRRGRFDGR